MSLTPLPTLDQLAADPARVRDLPPEMARDLLLRVIGLQTALLAQALSHSASGDGQLEVPAEDRLLTVAEVAARLAVPKQYVYEMAQRGELPSIRFGKYVRVPLSALLGWQEKHLDKRLPTMYSPPKDERGGAPANPKAAQAHAGGARGPARRLSQHRRTVGARRGADPRGDGSTDSIPRQDGGNDRT